MNDYIDRQAAIDAILECCASDFDNEYECGYDDGLRQGVHRLKHLPSAEVEPVKRGRWIDAIYDMEFCFAECDQCHNKAIGIGEYTGNSFDYRFPRYCPNCGAKMEPISASPENA